jgi:polygalacturonase
MSKHLWDESTFPDKGAVGVADAIKDCGAKGDGATDDTEALQTCLTQNVSVFLPPGVCVVCCV